MKSYNSDSEYSKIIEELKALPKINAPENFEFNLMTRIENKNFGEIKEEKAQFTLFKFLAPSAVVVTVLILFFLFINPNQQQIDNPLMSDPTAIAENQQVESVPETKAESKEIAKNTAPSSKINEPAASNNRQRGLNGIVQPNDVVVSRPQKYPLNRSRSVALDEFISGDTEQASTLQRGNVVNEGDQSSPLGFDGFLIRQKPDKETIEKYRAALDSSNRAKMKADSLKKAKK